MTRAADLLLKALSESEIKYIFGLPGSTEAPLLDALIANPEIHYVLSLHESIVIGMADGYARATGKPAIANLHTTVGTGNGLTGLFNAWKDHSPVVTIATHKHSRILGRDGFCVGPDLAEWAAPVTKWSWQGIHADQITNEIFRAIKVSGTAPYGPTYLCYPEDILGLEVEPSSTELQKPVMITEDTWPSPDQIDSIALRLARSVNPVIIAGDEISSTNSAELLAQLANMLSIPVFQESRRSALNWNISTGDPAYAGEYSPKNPLVRDSDCILALGCRLSVEFSPVSTPDVPPSAFLIHVHRDPWEVGKLYPPQLPVVASVRPVLKLLIALLENREVEWNNDNLQKRKLNWPPRSITPDSDSSSLDSKSKLTPEDLAKALSHYAPEDSVIVDEAIRSSPALLEHFPLRPGCYFHSSGGGLGWGLPAALGIQMAWPDRCVIAALGDGSLLFAIQALWTAVRESLPVKIVVFNNSKYLAVKAGMVEYDHLAMKTQIFPGVDLTNPLIDLVSVAKGFGVASRKAETPEQLDEILKWGFSYDGPVLIDVVVDDSPLGKG